MTTHKVWRAVLAVLEDVHGEPGTMMGTSELALLIEKVEDVEQWYIDHRMLPDKDSLPPW